MAENNGNNMKELVLLLEDKDRETLGAVRCLPSLLAAGEGGFTWLRGITPHEPPALQIRQLPAVHTYLMDEQHRLFHPGAQTPVRLLPDLSWQQLTAFIPVTMPGSAMPGSLSKKHPLRLRPSSHAQESNALLTDLDLWKTYAEQAPLVRLQQLRFAVSEENRVLILGTPLPALPGKEYVMRDHILLPGGFDFDPAIAASLVARQLNPLQNAVLLFDETGSFEHIPYECFVPATRSAVRLTKEKKANE